jgi:hypothetical protein
VGAGEAVDAAAGEVAGAGNGQPRSCSWSFAVTHLEMLEQSLPFARFGRGPRASSPHCFPSASELLADFYSLFSTRLFSTRLFFLHSLFSALVFYACFLHAYFSYTACFLRSFSTRITGNHRQKLLTFFLRVSVAIVSTRVFFGSLYLAVMDMAPCQQLATVGPAGGHGLSVDVRDSVDQLNCQLSSTEQQPH